MINNRLRDLFAKIVDVDDDVWVVIQDVLQIEQAYISRKNPRGVMGDIDRVVSRVSEKGLNS